MEPEGVNPLPTSSPQGEGGVASMAPGRARGATQATPTKPLNGFWDIGESGASEGRNINHNIIIITKHTPTEKIIVKSYPN